MDLTSATLLTTAVFAIVQGIKKLIPNLSGAALQGVVFAVGIAVTFLDAYSTYGSSQMVNHVALNNVNVPGLILIGLLVGGGATAFNVVFSKYGAISNIGQNQLKGTDAAAPSDAENARITQMKDRLTKIQAELEEIAT